MPSSLNKSKIEKQKAAARRRRALSKKNTQSSPTQTKVSKYFNVESSSVSPRKHILHDSPSYISQDSPLKKIGQKDKGDSETKGALMNKFGERGLAGKGDVDIGSHDLVHRGFGGSGGRSRLKRGREGEGIWEGQIDIDSGSDEIEFVDDFGLGVVGLGNVLIR